MTATNKYFESSPTTPEHPKVRAWSGLRAVSQRVELEVRRPREGFAFRTPRMYVTFYAADGTSRQDETEWELELDTWLLEQHVRARDLENEALRFALRFKASLRPIAIRFGDGFFNSVLVHQLRAAFGQVEPLAEVLASIQEYEAAGGSRYDCEQLIDFEISVAAQALLGLYNSDRAMAESVLIAALAQYLDERFHVTERRQFGFG